MDLIMETVISGGIMPKLKVDIRLGTRLVSRMKNLCVIEEGLGGVSYVGPGLDAVLLVRPWSVPYERTRPSHFVSRVPTEHSLNRKKGRIPCA